MRDHNVVNHPQHYTSGKVECIEAISAATASVIDGTQAFLTGQVIKYIWRWPLKNGLEDLEKCRWYLDRLINEVSAEQMRLRGEEDTEWEERQKT